MLWFLGWHGGGGGRGGGRGLLSSRCWKERQWVVGLSSPKKKETLSNTKSQIPTLPCPRDSAAGSKPPDRDNTEVEGKKVCPYSIYFSIPRHGGSEADCPSLSFHADSPPPTVQGSVHGPASALMPTFLFPISLPCPTSSACPSNSSVPSSLALWPSVNTYVTHLLWDLQTPPGHRSHLPTLCEQSPQ